MMSTFLSPPDVVHDNVSGTKQRPPVLCCLAQTKDFLNIAHGAWNLVTAHVED